MAVDESETLASLAASLQRLMHEQIPLTRATGFSIRAATALGLETAMPFKPMNYNDKNTAFAGSISALVNVTGWALLSLLGMHACGVRPTVAIFDSRVRFRRPIASDLRAQVTIGAGEKAAMLAALASTGRAKVRVTVNVMGTGRDEIAVEMDGRYVVSLPSGGQGARATCKDRPRRATRRRRS